MHFGKRPTQIAFFNFKAYTQTRYQRIKFHHIKFLIKGKVIMDCTC